MNQQNTYEKKNNKDNSGRTNIEPIKRNQRRSNTKNGKIQHTTLQCNELATSHGHAENYRNKLRNVTEIENPIIGEESDESELSIYRIERKNRIVDKNKYLTTILKINGKKITNFNKAGRQHDLKETEIQKMKHRYEDPNKDEVQFRGKIPDKIRTLGESKTCRRRFASPVVITV